MKKNCTNCNHAEFEVTKSFRRNLDLGHCLVKVILPNCFSNYRGEFPTKNCISKHTNPDCRLWEKDKRKKGL